jgi:hypothetical protein
MASMRGFDFRNINFGGFFRATGTKDLFGITTAKAAK